MRAGRLVRLVSTALFSEYEAVMKRPEQRAVSGLSEADVDDILAIVANLAQGVDIYFRWPRDWLKSRLFVDEWVTFAVAQKVDSTEAVAAFLKHKAAGATGRDFLYYLDRVPSGPPDQGDELSEGWRKQI